MLPGEVFPARAHRFDRASASLAGGVSGLDQHRVNFSDDGLDVNITVSPHCPAESRRDRSAKASTGGMGGAISEISDRVLPGRLSLPIFTQG